MGVIRAVTQWLRPENDTTQPNAVVLYDVSDPEQRQSWISSLDDVEMFKALSGNVNAATRTRVIAEAELHRMEMRLDAAKDAEEAAKAEIRKELTRRGLA